MHKGGNVLCPGEATCNRRKWEGWRIYVWVVQV